MSEQEVRCQGTTTFSPVGERARVVVRTLSQSSNQVDDGVGDPPVRGRRLPHVTWWGCLLISSGGVGVAVYYAPEEMRIPLAIGGGTTAVVLSVAVSAAVYFRRASLDARAEVVSTREQLAAARGDVLDTRDEAHATIVSATAELRSQVVAAEKPRRNIIRRPGAVRVVAWRPWRRSRAPRDVCRR